MKTEELELLAKALSPIIKQFVSAQADILRAEFKSIIPVAINGIDGKDGIDGKSISVDDVLPFVKSLVEEEISKIPVPQNGKDGKDGEKGEKGDPGQDGAPGQNGVDGKDGKDGRDGIDGAKGEKGEAGQDGAKGKDGAPGRDGVDGKDGKDGEKGEVGPQGERGEKGLDGAPGADGKDGAKGADGLPGKDGQDGKDGIDGKSVDVSEITSIVKTLVGEAFAKVELPKDGLKGEDGRDAMHLQILPSIDEAKSYPRGTYASFKGGLWRSYEMTFGMRGWECIVNGVAEVKLEDVDDRTSKMLFVMSNGSEFEKTINSDAMLYRGVFKDNAESAYQKGDVVTCAGSTWHCNSETKARPGTNSDWTLIVKKGRDYKEPVPVKAFDPSEGVKLK